MTTQKKKMRICVDCGVEIRATWFYKTVEETRCQSCAVRNGKKGKDYSGENSSRWKGGIYSDTQGYIHVLRPSHPMSTKAGHVLRSHLVWEKANGRHVQSGEVIHHIDGDKSNDVIGNLRIMNKGEHHSLHNAGANNPAYKHGKYIGDKAKYRKRKEENG